MITQSSTPDLESMSPELFIGLSHFGLNPFEWSFELMNKKTILIKNKEIADLCLTGIIQHTDGRYRWINISLLNL
jgi:hypothetical protein